MRCEIFRTPDIAFAELESRLSERSRKLRSLEQCACSREQNPNVAAREALESFDSLARNLAQGIVLKAPLVAEQREVTGGLHAREIRRICRGFPAFLPRQCARAERRSRASR